MTRSSPQPSEAPLILGGASSKGNTTVGKTVMTTKVWEAERGWKRNEISGNEISAGWCVVHLHCDTYLRSVLFNSFFGLCHRAKALTDEIE